MHYGMKDNRLFVIFSCFIFDTATYRGCSSSISLPSDYKLMTTCNEENCNGMIYPPDRLICYKCNGSECSAPSGNSRPCLNYMPNDECYTNVLNENDTIRGCISDGNYTTFEYMVTCSTSYCNTEVSLQQLKCIQCTSNENSDCIGNKESEKSLCEANVTSTCVMSFLLGRKEFCYTYRSGGIIKRGCSSDFDENRPDLLDSGEVRKCIGTNCNNECEELSTCYVCSSTSDENCLANLTDGLLKTCDNEYSCYACLFDDNSISRGCGEAPVSSLASQCYSCGENGCNNQTVKQCLVCSSEDEENCSNINTLPNARTTKCLGDCLVRVTNQTLTERGCQTENIECSSNDLLCLGCRTELCNNISTPEPGIKCYQCRNGTSCMNLDDSIIPTICPYFGSNRCFQFATSNETMLRGCFYGDNALACIQESMKCLLCSTPGCNSIPYSRKTERSCIQCSNAKECAWALQASNGSRCDGTLLYNQRDDCYTNTILGAGAVATRGCATDSKCLSSGIFCDYCSRDDCNTQSIILQGCLQCSSEINGKCCQDGTCQSRVCPNSASITYEQRGCYLLQEDGEIERGCGTGLGTDQCSICNNLDGCNNRTLTRCYSCNSATDRNCVHPANNQGLGTTLCVTDCIETIVDGKYMVRGCESTELTCEGSNSTYCNTCSESLCNNVQKNLGELECYQCGEESSCEDVSGSNIMPTPCTYYEPDDKCIQFYENMTMIRGCLSDAIGTECQSQNATCLECDVSGCNNQPLYKEPTLSCITCSATAECRWGFEPSSGSPCKNKLFFWQNETCFTDMLNETAISRGCTADSGCSFCEECSSNNCNTESYAYQYCIQCNSEVNSTCVSGSSQTSSRCPAKVQTYANRGCYVLLKVDGNTFRGCSSGLVLPEDYKLQEKCNFEYCNTLIYPLDRRQCYKCEGANCASGYGNTRPCLNYAENDQCYTNVFSVTNTTRGCISDGNVTMTSFTVTCGTNNCNNRPSGSTLSCTKCSSDVDKDCVRNPQPGVPGENCTVSVIDTCTVFPLLGRNESCYVQRDGDLVKRGCYSTDFGPEGPEDVDKLAKCNEDMCNKKCLPEVACFKCNSSLDPNCANDLSQLQPEVCEDHSVSTCFGCLNDDGFVTRGCGSSNLTEGCLACDTGDGCNNYQIRYCYNCSSADDPNCAQLTSPETLDTKVCHSECMTKVIGMNTVRGCATDFQACENDDPNCKTCSEALCNKEIVPSDRLRCYHCDGTTPCLNITTKNEESLPCANYVANDKCMAYLSKNSIIRGCLSDRNASECIDAGNKCLTCSTPNCNGAPLLRPPQLLCIACYYLSECSWGFDPLGGRRCRGDVAFYQDEACFTYQYSDGSITRGCTLEGGCDSNNPNCKICDFDNCNNENVVYQSCIQCDSSSSDSCREESDGSSATKCPGDIQSYHDRGCYLWQKDGKVTRGCIAQLTPEERNYCKLDGNKDCSLCLDQACNKMKPPNSAQQTRSSAVTIGFLAALVFVRKFFN